MSVKYENAAQRLPAQSVTALIAFPLRRALLARVHA